jgi:pyruvate,water dikinase
MMTLDPITGDRSSLIIEAAYGLGAVVVNGEVIPDRFCVGKEAFEIRSRSLGSKDVAYRFDAAAAGPRMVPVPPAQQRAWCLSDAEAVELARLGTHMEQVLATARPGVGARTAPRDLPAPGATRDRVEPDVAAVMAND